MYPVHFHVLFFGDSRNTIRHPWCVTPCKCNNTTVKRTLCTQELIKHAVMARRCNCISLKTDFVFWWHMPVAYFRMSSASSETKSRVCMECSFLDKPLKMTPLYVPCRIKTQNSTEWANLLAKFMWVKELCGTSAQEIISFSDVITEDSSNLFTDVYIYLYLYIKPT